MCLSFDFVKALPLRKKRPPFDFVKTFENNEKQEKAPPLKNLIKKISAPLKNFNKTL